MSDLIMVEGQSCLDYIDKPIGFGSREVNDNIPILSYSLDNTMAIRETFDGFNSVIKTNTLIGTRLAQMPHDTNKRIVGLVTRRYDDGGLRVKLLGTEDIATDTIKTINLTMRYTSAWNYELNMVSGKWDRDEDTQITLYPNYEYNNTGLTTTDSLGYLESYQEGGDYFVPFDEVIDYTPHLTENAFDFQRDVWNYHNAPIQTYLSQVRITPEKDNTLEFGVGIEAPIKMETIATENPLSLLGGTLYNYLTDMNFRALPGYVVEFPDQTSIDTYVYVASETSEFVNYNLVCIPYNIILTESELFALDYLSNGTLPPDAFLYPLDWENLPRYDETVPTGDQPDDYPDDNTPDDDLRDFDPTPNEIVSYTVNQLTNYNWYWLTVPQWSDFINWFWHDIGNYSDFDDIIAKVKGLYNDVASAVIMCRYYPVNYKWITQKRIEDAPTGNIKLGMIEKAGAVQMIDQEHSLRTEDIGHIHIGEKYKSFMDMSPYSQLSLYLPWHGFIDLDMNLFNGHDVYVKALYDYLSGTIQYYVFYDNEVLVNTILCKMAMDIPITLQTKNDRDSAIFNNVSSTIGGLVGAGAGILSGNPIGMTLGVTQGVGAFNSSNASAPMRLMGNVGESGAYIGCQNCFIVVRRPTIQPSDGNNQTSTKGLTTWKKNVGMLCGYGYTLSSLSGQGFTVCHSPRIDFTSSAPLQSEVDEIYNYLEKGVIL